MNISIYVVLSVMIYLIAHVQTNIINSILFALNIALIGFLIKGDSKPSTFKHLKNISQIIKVYSLMVLVLDVIYIGLSLGNEDADAKEGSYEYYLQTKIPFIFNNLDIIGFKLLLVENDGLITDK
jgi:hypothetical protein